MQQCCEQLDLKTSRRSRMLVGIMGKMGSGKTLAQSILASVLHEKTGLPLFANYTLHGATIVEDMGKIWQMDSAIFCFDEIWLSADSRLWQDNVLLTQWINQTRKKKLLVFYTTQHISQVEMRIRKGTDYLIYTQRKGREFLWNFIDYQYGQLGRRLLLNDASRFFDLYNTFEVVRPISMSGVPASIRGEGGKICEECEQPFTPSEKAPWAKVCFQCFKRSSKRRS
jgi:energy-coupling factor transporter ATP-binding protein EcfA2